MSNDDTEERVAPALALLDELDARTDQRVDWLHRLAEDGLDARGLYAAAYAWAYRPYERST
jgi:hypothetical protein